MRAIITADWHFGYPGRLDDLAWAFNKVINYCVDNDIKVIKILGDITHDREHMSHDVSNTISDLLDQANNMGIQVISFVGNHDMFLRHKWCINAIKPFSRQLTYIDNISYYYMGDRKFWVVPFIEHEPSYMKVIRDVDKMASEEDVLLTHIGIASATMNACFLVQNWNMVSFENTKFSRIYAGHFHCQQKVGSKSWYPGSPLPFRFDEGLVTHGFFDYDSISNSHEFIEIFDEDDTDTPPDYITVSSEDIDVIINKCKNDHVKIQLQANDDKDIIQRRLKEAGVARVVFVKPKEEKIEVRSHNMSKSHDIFESWLDHDNPVGLNRNLLLELNKQIRNDTRIEDD